ncbi:MAG: triose-phosphate isomerase [Firmicutes bacterium]|nr:triose-phosphate isomerase [Bacillota bacterium]
MRKAIIAGNWKMNKTSKEAKEFIEELKPKILPHDCEVVICAPFTICSALKKAARGTDIKIGAQNVHFAKSGAYTGEISVDMLKEIKVEYVIIGHSERRQYFNETDETVNLRAKAAVAGGLKAIVCIGETLIEREEGKTNEVLLRQITYGLKDLTNAEFKKIVIAYEPVWAIGTGKTATAADADETIAYIRKVIGKQFSKPVANNLRIQYGGSMNIKNVKELMSMENIDGGLIGGASLVAEDFAKLINYKD